MRIALKDLPDRPRYYDPVKHWPKIRPHLANPVVQKVLIENFNKYTTSHLNRAFTAGMYPQEFDGYDWTPDDIDWVAPEYTNYVCHSACHFLVNHGYELARHVEPNRPWRIVTSVAHSTVWDGRNTLFDFNFLTFGIPAWKALAMAMSGRMLKPGQHLKVGYTDPAVPPALLVAD